MALSEVLTAKCNPMLRACGTRTPRLRAEIAGRRLRAPFCAENCNSEGMGFGLNLRIAPGVSLRASPTGIRANVGPRAARVHAGSSGVGLSSGIGPFTASVTSSGSQRRHAKPLKITIDQRPPASAADSFKVGMELASGVMLMADYAINRHGAKQLAADSARAADAEFFRLLTQPNQNHPMVVWDYPGMKAQALWACQQIAYLHPIT